MLHCLRHNALIRRHDQQRGVDPRGTADHRAHEAFVAGHVDQVHHRPGHAQMGETQRNGDPPPLLLRKPVCFHPRQCSDQSRLAVVHVADDAQDKLSGWFMMTIPGAACYWPGTP